MTDQTTMSFSQMGLSDNMLKGLNALGFKNPTPIQIKSIPEILKSQRDLIGFAQTGTGKTAAFSLPILEKIDPKQKHVQAIILCPTRELCMQITKDITNFSKFMPKINAAAIYGGSSMRDQIQKLKNGAQIVVGTPGRVVDLINRSQLKLDRINFIVLDEADDMLDKGFKDDLDYILDSTPDEKQTLLFSATMSDWIEKVAKKRMHDPIEIKVANQNQGADTVIHQYVTVHAKDRYAALRRLLDINPDVYGIVFCRTRRQTVDVSSKLMSDHYSAEALHGDISQNERSKTMARFKNGEIQILVATDVAARGIDVNELTHVINYELPDSPETYVHRSGRTGRAGNTGTSLTIINMKEHKKLRRIEQIMKKKFEEIKIPTGKAICEAQLLSLVKKIKNTNVDHKNLEKYIPQITKELEGLSRDELIQHFVSVEFNRFLSHYSDTKDLSAIETKHDNRKQSHHQKDYKDITLNTYQINFGKKHGFTPKALFSLIKKNQSLRGIEIGDIKIDAKSTTFEADSKYHHKTTKFLGMEKFKGKQLRIDSL